MRKIEELIKANCHDGRLIGKEVADGVREVVHELWLVSNHEEECRLLRILRDLGLPKGWFRKAFRGLSTNYFNRLLAKCGIDWESKATRNNVVKEVKGLLREKIGWDEVKMCEEMFRFISIDVSEFRRYGIEPCVWLKDLELLSDLRSPYWLGLKSSDLAIAKLNRERRLELELNTTNTVDAIFFPALLGTVKAPSLTIRRERKALAVKYISKPIELSYYVDLSTDERPWPIELSADTLEKILSGFSDGEFAEFVVGIIDGDGTVVYYYDYESRSEIVFVAIAMCRDCPKSFILDMLRGAIAKKFEVIGYINSVKVKAINALVFYNKNAVKLLRYITKHMHHPLKRLRAELILAYYDGRISREEFERLYRQTMYKRGEPDIKRNHALEAIIRVAPQTHTHGGW
jgi:hypothetical protein